MKGKPKKGEAVLKYVMVNDENCCKKTGEKRQMALVLHEVVLKMAESKVRS